MVPLAEIEVDPSPPQTFVPVNLCRASQDAMTFLKAVSDPDLDTTSDQFVTLCETQWSGALSDLRQRSESGIPKAKAGWATIRYHWQVLSNRLDDMADEQDANTASLSPHTSPTPARQCDSCSICDSNPSYLLLSRLLWIPESVLASAPTDRGMRSVDVVTLCIRGGWGLGR